MDLLTKFKKVLASTAATAVVAMTLVVSPSAQAFDDVAADAWFAPYVEALTEAGVFKAQSNFRPADNMNRAEFVKTLVQAAGLSTDGAANAGFSDVSSSDWFYAYVNTAVENGIINGSATASTFRPADNVTRAEAVKIALNALGINAGDYSSPAAAFSDDDGHWAEDMISAAYNLSIVDGNGGSKTTFAPNAAISRSAVAKIASFAIIVAEDPDSYVRFDDGESAFSVFESDEIVSQVSALVKTEVAMEEEEEVTEEEEEETTTPVVVSDGSLEVSLSADNPNGSTLPVSTVAAQVLKVDFTANGDDVVINSVTVKRNGVGNSSDFSNVYLFNGAQRLRSGKTISSDTNTATFTNLGVNVEAGETITLVVKADVDSSASSNNQHQFSIASASAISSNGESVVGDFPINGGTFSIGGVTMPTVTLATAGSISSPSLGASGVEVANFKITAGSNDVKLEQVSLTFTGSMSKGDLGNFVLSQGSTELATSAAIGSNDLLTFVLATPYMVEESQNRNFKVTADLLGGKSAETFEFYLDETTDIVILDQQYGFGSALTNNLTSSNTSATSLQAGDVTVADNGPTASDIARNSTSVEVFKVAFTADRNVTVKDYKITLTPSSTAAIADYSATTTDGEYYYFLKAGGTTNTAIIQATSTANTATVVSTVSGTVASTDVDTAGELDGNVYPVVFVKNLKLVDTDTGSTIYSDSTSRYLYNNTAVVVSASDDFDVSAGQTRRLSVQVDVDSTATSGTQFTAALDFDDTNYIKDVDANQYLSASNIVGGELTGKNMSIVANSLTVTRSSTPVSDTFVKGTNDVDLLGFSMKAGDAGDIKVTKIKVRLLGDDDNTFDNGEGDTAANTLADSVSIYQGSTKIAGPKSLSLVGTIGSDGGYYQAEFNNLTVNVPAGQTATYTARVNLKNTVTATRYIAATLVSASDIEAEDSDGNTVTASTTNGGVNEDDDTTASNDTTPATTITISTSGSLTVKEEGAPDAAIVVAGATGVEFAKYKFNAVDEAFTVKKLDVVLDSDDDFTDDPSGDTGSANNIVNVSIEYADQDGATQTATTTLASGKASFSNLTLYVPKDGNASLTIKGDLNTIAAGATSGASVKLGLSEYTTTNAFEAVGAGSSETKTISGITITAVTTAVNAMTVRETAPTVAKAAGLSSSLINGENTVYAVTVAADAAEAVSLKRMEFTTSITGVTAGSFKVLRGTSDITDKVSIRNAAGQNLKSGGSSMSAAGNIYVTWDKATTDQEVISAGTSNTYYLKATISGAGTGDSMSTYIADDTTAGNATSTSAGVASLRTFTGSNPSTVDASTNGTRLIWRWASATTAYLDVNGSADYEAATDVLVTTEGTGDAAYTVDQIIPGALRHTVDAVDGADGGTYFDLDGDGDYVAGNDVAFNTTEPTGGDLVDNSLVTVEFRFDTGTTAYFDNVDNDDNAVASDSQVTITAPTTTPTVDTELYTASANFLWSDNSNNAHTTSTTDWTNGYLVENLSTSTHTLSY